MPNEHRLLGPWFRVYCDIYRNRKLRVLDADVQLLFLWLLALHKEGHVESATVDELAWHLRVDPAWLGVRLERLLEADLVDPDCVPVAWKERQFKSDLSTDRVRKHREKEKRFVERFTSTRGNVSETPIAEQSRTDQNRADKIVHNENVVYEWPLKDKTIFEMDHEELIKLKDNFPHLDVDQHLRSCIQWNIDNPTKRKTRRGIRKHIGAWLRSRVEKIETEVAVREKVADRPTRHNVSERNREALKNVLADINGGDGDRHFGRGLVPIAEIMPERELAAAPTGDKSHDG